MMSKKRLLALLMAVVMIMAFATTAFAATLISHTEDTSVLTLTSTGNTVTYTAVTVEGDPNGTGTGYPDVTTYSYNIVLPSTATSLTSVAITAKYTTSRTLKVDGVEQPFSVSAGKRVSAVTLDFTSGSKLFEIYSGTTLERSFVVTAGISGQKLSNVTMRINVQNAYSWLKKGNSMNATSSAGLGYLKTATGITVTNNVASDMSVVTLTGLPTGSTAMAALYYICGGVQDGTAVKLYKNGTDITATGLGIDIKGTGSDGAGHYTYISAMGKKALNNTETDKWLGERSTEQFSGWLYLNRESNGTYSMPPYGAAQYTLTDGEDIVWLFTNNFGDYDILNPSSAS